jgi:RecA-family ATPase
MPRDDDYFEYSPGKKPGDPGYKTREDERHSDYGADAPAGEPLIAPNVVDARSWHGKERPVRLFLDDRKWFRMGMVSNFSGPGGIGKTMAALQACVACASATQWLSRDIMAGSAMFYSAEEPIDEIHTRVDEYCEAESLHLNQFPHPLEIVDTSWHPNASLIEVSMARNGLLITLSPMYHWLKARMMLVKPKVLFIDNRAQVVVGNENDRNVAGFAMRAFATLAKDTGAAVIPLSHPSMAGSKTGSSGSTQWFNTARSNVFMTRPGQEDDDDDLANLEGDDGKRVLKNNKSNYGPINSEANVIWDFNRWKCTDAPVVTTSAIGKAAMYAKAERVFMELLRWHTDRGFNLTKTALPKQFDKQPKDKREGFNETWFEKAMLSLFDQGRIKLIEGRLSGHKTQFVVAA